MKIIIEATLKDGMIHTNSSIEEGETKSIGEMLAIYMQLDSIKKDLLDINRAVTTVRLENANEEKIGYIQ